MGTSNEFKNWLVNNVSHKTGSTLSKSSSYKYSRAINTISEDMISIGVLETNLYAITALHELERAVSSINANEDFLNKNIIGHNMYSVALNHYVNFLREKLYEA